MTDFHTIPLLIICPETERKRSSWCFLNHKFTRQFFRISFFVYDVFSCESQIHFSHPLWFILRNSLGVHWVEGKPRVISSYTSKTVFHWVTLEPASSLQSRRFLCGSTEGSCFTAILISTADKVRWRWLHSFGLHNCAMLQNKTW